MDEQERPKLRLIRGGAGATDSGDHADPHGMPRPGGYVLRKGRTQKPVESTQGDQPPTGTEGSTVSEPYIEPDPTPPYGTVRPKQFKVIKGEKE